MNSRLEKLLCRAAVLGAVAMFWLVAPAWAQPAGEKVSEDRKAFRESVLGIKGQIDTTLKALDGIQNGKDDKARKSALKEYSNQLKAMDKQIQKTRDYAQKMKESGQSFFKEWEKSMKGVTNPTLTASATQRRDMLKAQYDKVEAGITQAKEISPKFWKDLQDMEGFFSKDLSDNSLATSADLVKSTMADGKKIEGYIDDVIKAVDEVGKVVEKPAEAKPVSAAGTEAKPEEKPPQEEKPPTEKPPVQRSFSR